MRREFGEQPCLWSVRGSARIGNTERPIDLAGGGNHPVLTQTRDSSIACILHLWITVELSRTGVSDLALRGGLLECEIVVDTVIAVPPFVTVHREANTHDKLTFIEFPLVVLELDREGEPVPAFVPGCIARYMCNMKTSYFGYGSALSA